MEKTFADFVDIPELEEGVNDPAIFKAVFLAGGPGSGKSFMVGQTGLNALGFKIVNSDQQFELALKNANLSMKAADIFSTKGQSLRDRAKLLTQKRQDNYLVGRLGLVIDGTGREYDKISKQKKELEKLGYETAMIMVNTDLDTAVGRDKARTRTLGASAITPMWKSVQKNIGRFQNLFRGNFFIVDNSEGADYQKGALTVYRKIHTWSRQHPKHRLAKAWIKDQKQQRDIKEAELPPHLKRHFDKDGNVKKGSWKSGDWKADKKQPKVKFTVKDVTPKGYGPREDIDKMDMGDVIKDFYKSDAPQFKGKSKKKRREMAIAAKLATECKDEKDFKPHMMYDPKTGKGVKANTYMQHVALDKRGYVHEKPEIKEDLRKWFGKGKTGGAGGGGWDRYNAQGDRVGKCGDGKEGGGYAACLSKSAARKLGKKGRASFVRRKKAAQQKAGRGRKGTGSKGKAPVRVSWKKRR